MVKRVTKTALRKLGVDLQRYRPWKHLHVFFKSWRALGLSPRFVIDVGANHGDWTRTARSYFPEADYLMIEPQADLKIHFSDLLRSSKITWKNVGLSDAPGRLELHLAARDDSASFRPLPPESSLPSRATISVEVTTLDEIVRQAGRTPDLLKIDAEGYDLHVLRGATKLLETTELILVECSLCGRDFVNTLPAITSFLASHDYTLIDFTDLNRSPNQDLLWLCEAAFLRNSSPLWKKIGGYDATPSSAFRR